MDKHYSWRQYVADKISGVIDPVSRRRTFKGRRYCAILQYLAIIYYFFFKENLIYFRYKVCTFY